MPDQRDRAAYYRLRAKQLREIALDIAKDNQRDVLLQCAADLDHLATMQETLARDDPK